MFVIVFCVLHSLNLDKILFIINFTFSLFSILICLLSDLYHTASVKHYSVFCLTMYVFLQVCVYFLCICAHQVSGIQAVESASKAEKQLCLLTVNLRSSLGQKSKCHQQIYSNHRQNKCERISCILTGAKSKTPYSIQPMNK